MEWLLTDDRTKSLVRIGSPVGWAAYTGQLEIMRLLVQHGADPAATHQVLWGGAPSPLLVAAQNGKLEAMKYLVNECNQDVRMKDPRGKGILENVEDAGNWRELKGHVAAHKWVKKKLRQA